MTESAHDPKLEALLDYLKRARGFDFTAYKRSTLSRRIQKRMQSIGLDDYERYLDYLQVHPDEFPSLFNMILINVTNFFRDRQTWDYVNTEVIPRILASKGPEDPIRVWSAGCASGEEAYTIAMLFTEAIGIDAFRDRVKVYATDVDEEALTFARQAIYTQKQIAEIPEPLLEKYFEQLGIRYSFNRDLRKSVIFGRHDLIQDAPISRIDLLVCRNTLMYFNSEAQAKILDRFHFALNTRGYFLLGKAEMLFTHNALFVPVDLKRRIFTKQLRGNLRERLVMLAPHVEGEILDDPTVTNHLKIRDSAFDLDPVAQVIVDAQSTVVMANHRARSFFGISRNDIGRPLQDLEISYRPVELRSCIRQAQLDQRAVTIKDIVWRPMIGESDMPVNEARQFDVQVIPLMDEGATLGVKVMFNDVTRYKELQDELRQSKQDLETAYEELQSTNEELVTTNEELQSTVEELETTNEELQSTNEELETMNEELQSTNEELQTINDELRMRSDELNRVNGFLESILGSLKGGVIVVDDELHIRIWNHKSEDLWGLRSDEVQGKHLLTLDIGLPVDRLKQPIRACLSGDTKVTEVVIDAINRRGRSVRCKASCTRLQALGGAPAGAVIVVEELKS